MLGIKFGFSGLRPVTILVAIVLGTGSYIEDQQIPRHSYFDSLIKQAVNADRRTDAQSKLAKTWTSISFVDSGLAYDIGGSDSNKIAWKIVMRELKSYEKTSSTYIDRREVANFIYRDFMEDYKALQDPDSQASKLGINCWDRFK